VHEQGLQLLGAIPRNADLQVPSRHLGLVTAVERGAAARRAVAEMRRVVEQSVDLDAVVALARSAPPLDCPPWKPEEVVS
ncbi:hypothetical protein NQD87_26950, partial [Escherichia coli]|nr:hypothetical protein [Escherichia coli]